MSAIEELYKTRPDLYVSAIVRLIPVHHKVEAVDRRAAIEYSTEELLDMRRQSIEPEVIEHQPEKIISWPKSDRRPGEPLSHRTHR